ncbi:MAG: response regulator [Proteobacteria bacterium]|nr:response regulator [Pseudomonadota bacterium]
MNMSADINIVKNFIPGQKCEKKYTGPDHFDFLRDDHSRLYDFLPIGYVVLDENGMIKSANLMAAQLLGVDKSHLIHRDLTDSIHKDDHKKIRFDKTNGSYPAFESFDMRFKNQQNYFWARVTLLIDEAGCPGSRQVKLTFHDISQLRQVEHENAKLKHKLQQTQKMEAIGELSSGIAHDFNNILHPIIGSLDMLIQDAAQDRKLQKALKNILTGANRASSLVRQILSFSHQEECEVGPVKIQSILREVIKLSRSTLPETIKIILPIDNACGPVMADPIHIYQIGMNLITNAFHAMGQNGGILDVTLNEVDITTDISGGMRLNPGRYACIGVADTGAGIDVSILNKIFDPYFTTKEKGTGLGLPVIAAIIKNYGGDICFSSDPGKGSLFQVYLPLGHSHLDTSQPKNGRQKEFYGCESILFVDDDPFIVDIQKETLERYGYSVIPCISSLDALNEFKARPGFFDIVICDMTLPAMTGLTLAFKIKQIKPDIPVIICTGFSEVINEENYHDMGIDGFLMKPVSSEETLELVRHLLNNK